SESAQESPAVIESTERLPTVASQQEPTSTSQSHRSEEPNPPPVGEGPDVAALRETEPPSAAIDDQESVIHPRGPLSVNAKGVGPVGAYLAYLERTIYRYWQIPPEANLLTQSVSLTIEFEIAKDGRLLSLRLYNSTGMRSLDRAAMRAIQMAAPFRPLPDVFPGPSQLFTDTFIYHPPPSSS
ncbi:MAG: TonB family protein, partial [Acidobacteria bacterium]